MARLEAIAKELYYPTPTHLMEDVGKCFTAQGTIKVLDTCCGEGLAVKALANSMHSRRSYERLKPVLFGVELNELRAQQAASNLDVVLHAPMERVFYAPESWDLLFLNPPYDQNGSGGRMELDFMQMSYPLLKSGGHMVLVIPDYILAREDVMDWLDLNFQGVRVYRFPDEEYQVFKQVVVMGEAVSRSAQYRGKGSDFKPRPWHSLLEWRDGYAVSIYGTGPDRPTLQVQHSIPEAPQAGEGAYGDRSWELWVDELEQSFRRPLLAPRKGHRAMMLAAGSLDGIQIQDFLVRARALKLTDKTTTKEGDEISTERIVTEFCTLSLTDKTVERWTTDEQQRTADWIREHSEAISAALENAYTPQFHDEQVAAFEPFFEEYQPPGILPGRDKPEWPFAQKRVICAIHDSWRRGEKSVILSGEMGLGKTAMGTAAVCLAAVMGKAEKAVVVCPGHLTDKWRKEPQKITGDKCSMIARKASDVHRFFEDPKMRFLIVSKEKAKLGTRFIRGSALRRSDYFETGGRVEVCADCGKPPHSERHSNPHKPDKKLKKREKCIHCGAAQWEYTKLTAKGTKRWPLAKVISKYARRYYLIMDEAHQYAKSETDQAKAVQRLISNATKVVAMTGTVYSGRASSLFHLLYKLLHSFRERYRYDDVALFAQHYGLFESVVKNEDAQYSTYGYRRGTAKARIKEIPGMSPAMIPLILPNSVFVKLSDLGEDLPPYEEEVRVIDGDPAMTKAASAMQAQARAELRKHPGAAGSYLMACLGYPDCPERGDEVVAQIRCKETREWLREETIATAPPLEVVSHKDLEVLKEAKIEKEKGRKVLVYCTQTGKRDTRGRLKALLESHGLRVVVLDQSVAPEKRIPWVSKQEKEGFDVMITNGRLVETGVDLMWATTIIQYGIEYSINTLRQSTRRSWRLGQLHPVKVIYLAYRSTMQEAAVKLIAKKAEAANLVEGDELGGLAQSGGGSIQVELLRELV